MTKMIMVDVEKCTGCGVCELMCSFHHHPGEFDPRKARITKTVFLHEEMAIPVVCQQCVDPPCAAVCRRGAITRVEDVRSGTAVVLVDPERCNGCKLCVAACPSGSIVVDEGCAEKCDLCGGDPECVKFCQRGALRFKNVREGAQERRREVALKMLAAHREAG